MLTACSNVGDVFEEICCDFFQRNKCTSLQSSWSSCPRAQRFLVESSMGGGEKKKRHQIYGFCNKLIISITTGR